MKTQDMLNAKIGALIERFAVHGKVKLVGSQQRRGQLFTSDYDILTQLNGRPEFWPDISRRSCTTFLKGITTSWISRLG